MSLSATRQIATFFAFLLVGLQSFALFHGASYGFEAHDHGVQAGGRDRVAVFSGSGRVSADSSHDGHGDPIDSPANCDLMLYLDGHARLLETPVGAVVVRFEETASVSPIFNVFVAQTLAPSSPRDPPHFLLA